MNIRNRVKTFTNSYLKIPRLAFPTELEFEPIQLCNALCFTCPYPRLQEDKEYRGKKMSREKIKILLNDFGDLISKNKYKGPTIINPFRYSDPLVCKDLDLILEIAKQKNVKVRITTNGVSFNDYYSDLLNFYIDVLTYPISISVIGSTEEKIKKNMNVNLSMTLSRLKKLKEKFPKLSDKVVVNLSEIDETNNEKLELEKLNKLFHRIGYRTNVRKKWINNRIAGDWNTTSKQIISNEKENFVKGCNLYRNKLLRRIEVMVDGSVVLCDDDAEGKHIFGNVFLEGIEKIWNGSLLQYHRKIYNKNNSIDKKNLICNSCSRAEYNKRKNGILETFAEVGRISLLSKIVKNEVEWI